MKKIINFKRLAKIGIVGIAGISICTTGFCATDDPLAVINNLKKWTLEIL